MAIGIWDLGLGNWDLGFGSLECDTLEFGNVEFGTWDVDFAFDKTGTPNPEFQLGHFSTSCPFWNMLVYVLIYLEIWDVHGSQTSDFFLLPFSYRKSVPRFLL